MTHFEIESSKMPRESCPLLVETAAQIGQMAIGDFFVDPLTTALEPGEIVTHMIVPNETADMGTCYKKVEQSASGYAMVGIAVRLQQSSGKITQAHIGVTGLTSKAFRATLVERALLGGASA